MSSSQQKSRVLIVDDTPENIEVLAEILGNDYEALVAINGATALEIAAKKDHPNLVLLDVMMPEMDGYEVCRRLKANGATRDIPIIFVTAMNDVEDETHGFELGAVDFITKPLNPAVVRARVRTHLALKEARDRIEGISDKISKYVSPQIKQSIIEGKQHAEIGSSRKKLTVFFSDIVGFTSQTDHMEPEDMTMILNSYLDRMSVIALKYGGTVDKFIGDAILVFFGDPETKGVAQDALACVEMALEMQMALEELKEGWENAGIVTDFQIRVGITSGYCTVGNFGSEERMDYTIIGGQVNLASRLETNASPSTILISEETYALVQNTIECTPKEPIHVKGIGQSIQTYQVIGRKEHFGEDHSITDSRHGFSISLDPSAVSEEEKHQVLERLRAAISSLS